MHTHTYMAQTDSLRPSEGGQLSRRTRPANDGNTDDMPFMSRVPQQGWLGAREGDRRVGRLRLPGELLIKKCIYFLNVLNVLNVLNDFPRALLIQKKNIQIFFVFFEWFEWFEWAIQTYKHTKLFWLHPNHSKLAKKLWMGKVEKSKHSKTLYTKKSSSIQTYKHTKIFCMFWSLLKVINYFHIYIYIYPRRRNIEPFWDSPHLFSTSCPNLFWLLLGICGHSQPISKDNLAFWGREAPPEF